MLSLLPVWTVGACAEAPEAPGETVDDADADTSGGTDVVDTGLSAPPDTGPLPLCVNEFMPDNDSSWRDDLGAAPDWIELHNPTDATVDLSGWTLSDDETVPDKAALSGVVEAGGYRFFRANDGLGDDQLPFRLSADGGQVALFAPDGRGQVVTHGVVAADFSVARAVDCCAGDACLGFSYRGTPGYGNAEPAPPGEVALPAGSYWEVLAWPAVPAADWAAPAFDASAWTVLQAPLGYGEDDLVSTLDAGPPEDRVRTVWARAGFALLEVPDSGYLRLRADDGARVLLNGSEVARVRMPEGDIAPETLASEVLGGDAESEWAHVEIDPGALLVGDNLVAVEVHQATPTSEDLVLDLAVFVRP